MAHLLSYLLDKAIDTFSSGVSRLPRSRKSKLDDTILGSFLICVLKSSSLFAIYIYIEFYVILDRHMHRKLIWIVFQLSRGMKNKTGSFSSLSLDFMSNLPLINATFFARFIGWHSLIQYYQSFSLEHCMITPKNQINSPFQTKILRNNKIGSQKMYLQSLPYENQNSSSIITNPPTSTYDNLRAVLKSQTEDENILPFRLPQIGKKHLQIAEQPKLNCERDGCDNVIAQELKRLQANPYLKKYVGLASKERLKRDNSCSFLNIVSVKPVFRSSTRMGTSKDTNMTLTHERTEKLIPYRPDEKYSSGIVRDSQRIKTISHAHNSHISETSASKRSTIVSIAQKQIKPRKRLSLLPKQPLKSLSIEKKTSLKSLRLDKPKQSPNYSEWCTFFGTIDGISSEKEGGQYYKAFVGKGNNSVLVKNIIKNRPWWTICQQQSDAHLYWTQARNSKYLQALKEGKKVETIAWESQPAMRMELFGNCQNCINDKVRQYAGIGFQKVLSKTQRQILSRSSINLLVPTQSDIMALDSNKQKSHNHLEFNWNLSNKKALYYNLKSYYLAVGKSPFEYIPQTYHIQKQGDTQWTNFIKNYEKKTLWIVKPGENSNRGCGIDVVETIDEIKDIIKNKSIRPNGKQRSHIVQRYLMPFLYNKRKFDIRCYMLVTSIRGNLRCYWYEEGYIRTASKQFTTKNLKNRMIHLTNDAVQKHSEQYGKYESGNKLSFNDFNKYVKNTNPEHDFYQQVYPRMMELAADAIRSTHLVIDAKNREFSFQIFGLDFMIDEKFQTWLIEVNTNPCLQLSCPLLARIIPSMVQNAFKIAVDPIFPPPKDLGRNRNLNEDLFQSNKFTLIFSSREESDLQSVLKNQKLENIIESEDQDESIHDQQE